MNSVIHCIERAWKLGQHIVPNKVHHAAFVFACQCCHFISIEIEGSNSRYLVVRYETTVTDYISTEDGGEFMLKTNLWHRIILR